MPALVAAFGGIATTIGTVIGTVGASALAVVASVRIFTLIKFYMLSRIVAGAVRESRRND